METFLADTHAIVWYVENHPKLGKGAGEALDLMREAKATILISVMTLLEIDYLVERYKVSDKLPGILLKSATESSNSLLKIVDINLEVYSAFLKIPSKAIPELPDRIIAATALAYSCPLITKDSKIARFDKIRTIW